MTLLLLAKRNYIPFTGIEKKGRRRGRQRKCWCGGRCYVSWWEQTLLLSWLGDTHAGDTEDTDEASVLEALESSELSSTFFPKSCKMQFRNWQDRKCYSTEQKGPCTLLKVILGEF